MNENRHYRDIRWKKGNGIYSILWKRKGFGLQNDHCAMLHDQTLMHLFCTVIHFSTPDFKGLFEEKHWDNVDERASFVILKHFLHNRLHTFMITHIFLDLKFQYSFSNRIDALLEFRESDM